MIYHPEKSVILCEEIPESCVVHAPVWIGKNVKIGERVKIQAFSFIPDGVIIGNDVFIGPGVVFTNDLYPPSGGVHWKETIVHQGVSIGANATILPGVELWTGCRIGAGAVVTKNIPPHEVWAGNPAKRLRALLPVKEPLSA